MILLDHVVVRVWLDPADSAIRTEIYGPYTHVEAIRKMRDLRKTTHDHLMVQKIYAIPMEVD